MQRKISFLFYDILLTLHSTANLRGGGDRIRTRARTRTHKERKGKNVALLAFFRVNLNCFFSARSKDAVYRGATQGSLTEIQGRFEGVRCLSLQDRTPILHEDGTSIHGSCPYTSKTSIFLLSSDEN
jgi:hypothetical protein